MKPEDVLRQPLVTEKTVRAQEENNQYTFEVHPDANKIEIRRAVEDQFEVDVTQVRTMNVRGKEKRVRQAPGYTADWKKAIVTLSDGDHIEIMEGLLG